MPISVLCSQCTAEKNVASQKYTMQSSEASPVDGSSNLAVDDDNTTCSQTNKSEKAGFWMVDLGRDHVISRIKINTGAGLFM